MKNYEWTDKDYDTGLLWFNNEKALLSVNDAHGVFIKRKHAKKIIKWLTKWLAEEKDLEIAQ